LRELEKLGIKPVASLHPALQAKKPAPHVKGDATPEQLHEALAKITKFGGQIRYYYDNDVYFLHPLADQGSGGELDFYSGAGDAVITPPGPITPFR
jgi:hypothetical protein